MKTSRDQAIVLFGCATGLRPGEWRALKHRDVDKPKRALSVSRSMQNEQLVDHQAKTRGSLRTVLLSDLALEALALLPTPLRQDQLVFPGRDGASRLDIHAWRRNRWGKALEAAGVSYR